VRAERNRYKEEAKRASARVEALIHRVNKAESERDSAAAVAREWKAIQASATLVARVPIVTQETASQTTATGATVERATNTENEVKTEKESTSEQADLTVTSANFLYNEPKGGSSEDSGVPPLPMDSDGSMSTADNVENQQISRFLNDALSLEASGGPAEQINHVKFRLEEALKTLEAERGHKQTLLREIDGLHEQVSALESESDGLRIARQEASRDLLLARNQGQERVRTLQLQLEEQQAKRNGSEQLIGHLREELERLQSENAEEWGRRERLDAEKQNCERENRKLRHQLDEVKDRARKLSEQHSQLAQGEVGRMRAQTDAASRELLELRHSHGRLRKAHADRGEEMTHWRRKAETSEKEVKRLRARIEELKKELARAEDQMDESANCIRRLQRSNEELLSQAEGYQVQIEHLGSRLRAIQPSQTEVLMANFGTRRHSRNAMEGAASASSAVGIGAESPIEDLDTSEESLPIFDEDDDDDDEDDDELDLTHEIETDV